MVELLEYESSCLICSQHILCFITLMYHLLCTYLDISLITHKVSLSDQKLLKCIRIKCASSIIYFKLMIYPCQACLLYSKLECIYNYIQHMEVLC